MNICMDCSHNHAVFPVEAVEGVLFPLSGVEEEKGQEGDHKSQGKMEERRTEKQFKRIRTLDDDSDSSGEDDSVPFQFQDPSQHSQDREQERRQPATKKMRKWIDSDSDSESTSNSHNYLDDTANTIRHEREDGEVDSESENSASVAGGEASEGVEGGGGGREVESDSEGEGALEIDLGHQSQSSSGEMEEEGEEASIKSPVCDTVELLHQDEEGESGSEINSDTVEHGSLATLVMH